MRQFHPPICAPSHELDLFGVEYFRAHHRRRPVIFFNAFVDNEVLPAKILRHRRTWIWRGMLDVRPVDILPRKGKIGQHRLARVIRISHDESADYIHFVAVQILDCPQRGIADIVTLIAQRVLGVGAQKF